ncbi:MAG: phosphoglycerate dehydrogenase [Xanthomonadales bacterium]|nr:phosphoglycerate dehydrogenase [Gammaproteobacteria bacterium]MBT8053297.1 phosphoglycerate dehydrogenase [Gammaproteobacteria bacterium]NND58486.1 phosphoglycerate dehydrogenase [Xanthomonadales bacterium]NNK50093.1 phosphoglycerate dehydrogenase [Xanthomonadales bacterium]
MPNGPRNYSLDKSKIKFLLLEGIHSSAVELIKGHGYNSVELMRRALSGEELHTALQGVHFLGIRSRSQLNRAALQAADRLAAVGCFCIGTNQVDLKAAAKHGIPVFNAPFSNTRSVAELALAEAILLLRGIPVRNAAAHRGEWIKSASHSHEARGKTIGIIGYGHIGSQLGVLAESLGMRVLYYDIEHKLPLGNASNSSNLWELLSESHVVSLHVPETELTRHLADRVFLQAMQQGSFLINASRGHVVDIDALADALDSGHLAGAAIDVFPLEPGSNSEQFESRLRGMDNVILTPHIGGSTMEAQENIAMEVAGKLVKYSDNGTTRSAVNFPEVSLPDHENVSRIFHIHHNEPGVLQKINQVFSEHAVNIASQYLETKDQIGYVVMDIETDDPASLLENLRQIPSTIRARILH